MSHKSLYSLTLLKDRIRDERYTYRVMYTVELHSFGKIFR